MPRRPFKQSQQQAAVPCPVVDHSTPFYSSLCHQMLSDKLQQARTVIVQAAALKPTHNFQPPASSRRMTPWYHRSSNRPCTGREASWDELYPPAPPSNPYPEELPPPPTHTREEEAEYREQVRQDLNRALQTAKLDPTTGIVHHQEFWLTPGHTKDTESSDYSVTKLRI